VITPVGKISLRASHYLQPFGNMALMLPILIRPRIPRSGDNGSVVAQPGHVGDKGWKGHGGARGIGETPFQQTISRLADGFRPRSLPVLRLHRFFMQHCCRIRIKCRPGIPHGGGNMVLISGMERGACKVSASGVQQFFIPLPRNRMFKRPRMQCCRGKTQKKNADLNGPNLSVAHQADQTNPPGRFPIFIV